MHETSAAASDALARALGVTRAIDDTWAWATAPLTEAAALGRALAQLVEQRDLPLGGMRAMTQRALGEPARPSVVDRWLEQDVEVTALLRRVTAVSRALEGLHSRTRVAMRTAMVLALGAPALVRLAAAEVWRGGPAPDRDAVLRALEAVPIAAKRRAEALRAESGMAATSAQRATDAILDALRPACVRRRR